MGFLLPNSLKLWICILSIWQTKPVEDVFVLPNSQLEVAATLDGAKLEAVLGSGVMRPLDQLHIPDSGSYFVGLISRDAVGNVSPLKWIRLHVDGQPPLHSGTFHPRPFEDSQERSWLPAGAKLMMQVSDSGSGLARIDYRVNGTTYTDDRPNFEIALPATGKATIELTAVDQLGNRSQPALYQVWIDGLAPIGSVVLTAPQEQVGGTLVVGLPLELSVDLKDEGSGLSEWQPSLNSVQNKQWKGPWKTGEYLAEAEALDHVGNRGVLHSQRFFVDKNAPVIKWTIEGEWVENQQRKRYYRAPVSLTATASDEHTRNVALFWSVADEDWLPFEGQMPLDRQPIRLKAVDGVGNQRIEDVSWEIDSDPPEIFIENSAGQRLPQGATLSIRPNELVFPKIEDAGCGLDEVLCRIDNSRAFPITDSYRFENPGRFSFSISASDKFGNINKANWVILVTRTGSEVDQ